MKLIKNVYFQRITVQLEPHRLINAESRSSTYSLSRKF